MYPQEQTCSEATGKARNESIPLSESSIETGTRPRKGNRNCYGSFEEVETHWLESRVEGTEPFLYPERLVLEHAGEDLWVAIVQNYWERVETLNV